VEWAGARSVTPLSGEILNLICGAGFICISVYGTIQPNKLRKFAQEWQITDGMRRAFGQPIYTLYVWLLSVGFVVGGGLLTWSALSRLFKL
jgi:hypothetical protein